MRAKSTGLFGYYAQLPPDTQDFSQYIVDHSRSKYASRREYVERFVHERYLDVGRREPAEQQPAKPVFQPAAPAEPQKKPGLLTSPKSMAKAILATEIRNRAEPKPESAPQAAVAETKLPAQPNEAPADKPKRRRRRRKKTSAIAGSIPASQHEAVRERPDPVEQAPQAAAKPNHQTPESIEIDRSASNEKRELKAEHIVHLK